MVQSLSNGCELAPVFSVSALRLFRRFSSHAQIKDEPVVVFSEQRIWRPPATHGVIDSELLPEVTASERGCFHLWRC